MQLKIEKPSAPQRKFFAARERYIAYGGARGGGKSWAVRRKSALLAVRYPGIRILLLRRSYPELRENHILPMLSELRGIAAYRETDKAFRFQNGSRLKFGYCDGDKDILQYQGQEYDVIFIDEATQFSYEQFLILTACIRGVNNYPKRIYLTCNPGGIGHEWVKRLFVDRRYRKNEKAEEYCFIPARVYDNRALLDSDPEYVNMLEKLPPRLRKAWLLGQWDIFEGQFFDEFDHERHVTNPLPIPPHWRIYRTLDYGLDMLACLWIAVDEEHNAYVIKELYKSNLIISEAAQRIKSMSTEPVCITLAPPDMWHRRQESGRSVSDIFAGEGIALTKTSNNRIGGWLAVKEWLRLVDNKEGQKHPRLRIFKNCHNLIRTLPSLMVDEKNPNDCANEPHELTHAPDALRGFCIYRTMSAAHHAEDDYDRQVGNFLAFARNF